VRNAEKSELSVRTSRDSLAIGEPSEARGVSPASAFDADHVDRQKRVPPRREQSTHPIVDRADVGQTSLLPRGLSSQLREVRSYWR
jgi:hypothetical protein